jgi:hypothetical protein
MNALTQTTKDPNAKAADAYFDLSDLDREKAVALLRKHGALDVDELKPEVCGEFILEANEIRKAVEQKLIERVAIAVLPALTRIDTLDPCTDRVPHPTAFAAENVRRAVVYGVLMGKSLSNAHDIQVLVERQLETLAKKEGT